MVDGHGVIEFYARHGLAVDTRLDVPGVALHVSRVVPPARVERAGLFKRPPGVLVVRWPRLRSIKSTRIEPASFTQVRFSSGRCR